MIPFWLKIIWNIICGSAMLFLTIGAVIGIPTLIVSLLEEIDLFDVNKDREIIKFMNCCLVIGGILALITAVMFVMTMLYYQIPFNEWIG